MKHFSQPTRLICALMALGTPLLTSCDDVNVGPDAGVGRTQTVLFVDTDLTAEIGVIDGVVQSPSLATAIATATLGLGQLPPPRTLVIEHGVAALGPYRVELTANAPDGSPLDVSRTVVFTMQQGRTQRIDVSIDGACVGVVCASGLTCDDGVCLDPSAGLMLSVVDASSAGPLQGNFSPGAVRF